MYGVMSAIFKYRDGYNIVRDLEDADILVLTGGEDINPRLYNEMPIQRAGWNERRDRSDIEYYNQAVDAGKFIFGICRGGQLANVLNGGKLYQDITGHPHQHAIVDHVTGESIITSSVHHQMFRVGPKAEIIATCQLARTKEADGLFWRRGEGPPSEHDDDVEICYYRDTRSLCIQGHPEFGPDEFCEYSFSLIERYY